MPPPSSSATPKPPVGLAYTAQQLQRALDAAARNEPAQERVRRWRDVLGGLLAGTVQPGSRQPVAGYPAWVTLEVVTGGFATGKALSGGSLQPFEYALLRELGLSGAEASRLALNRHFLSEAGLLRLLQAVESRALSIQVPEEAALPTVAWLVAHGHADEASRLVQALAPYAHELRLYPRLDEQEPASDGLVHLESAGQVVKRLRDITPNPRVLAQRCTVDTWLPLYDAAVALVLETVEGAPPITARNEQGQWQRGERGQFIVDGGWPFKHWPEGWSLRARRLLGVIHDLQRSQPASKRFTAPDEPLALLVHALRQAAIAPEVLTGREVGRVRLIVARHVASHGDPNSGTALAKRQRQRQHATRKTHQEIAAEVAGHLAQQPAAAGLDDVNAVLNAVGLQGQGTRMPTGIRRRLERCVNDTPEGLIRRGVVGSGEVLAALLPQRTSQLRAASFADPGLRALYAATYRAFRRRRSLLLLNLQKQVQLEELPWIAVMQQFRSDDGVAARAAGEALEEFAAVALSGFPQTMLPNKLLQEFTALAKEAGKPQPFTEELAADIFVGRFSPKFVEAAHIAAVFLRGTLYERYYRLDYREIANRLAAAGPDQIAANALATICDERARPSQNASWAARNGALLEQQLIITSHNLADLCGMRGVREHLAGRGLGLARDCFAWTVRHLQLEGADWRTELHRIKNAAYAWRQMVFFLSLRSFEAPAFLAEAQALLDRQPEAFRKRFQPALDGLQTAVQAPERWASDPQAPFLGWQDTARWKATVPVV